MRETGDDVLKTTAMTKKHYRQLEVAETRMLRFPYERQGSERLRMSTSEGHWKRTGLESHYYVQGFTFCCKV